MAYSLPEILTQLEMHYNMIAATLPCLRIFLKGFQTGELGGMSADWREQASISGKSTGRVRLWSLDNNLSNGSELQTRSTSVGIDHVHKQQAVTDDELVVGEDGKVRRLRSSP